MVELKQRGTFFKAEKKLFDLIIRYSYLGKAIDPTMPEITILNKMLNRCL